VRAAEKQVLRGHVPAAAARLTPDGLLPGTNRLHLAIGLPLRHQEALSTLLQELYDPASPHYHQWLTPEEFTQRFGPTEEDYESLIAFAQLNRLTVTARHPNRVVLDVEGTVAGIQKVFHVTLRLYDHPKEARRFYAPDAEPSVDVAVPLLHISGLDNYSLPHPNLKALPADKAPNTTPRSGSGPNGSYLGSDFRAAYVPGTALNGAGQSVGLLQFDGYHASAITAYENLAGLPNVTLVNVPVDGGVSTPGSGEGEVCLDIEMVMSMAPGISKIYVYEAPNPSPWPDLLSRMANDNLAKQLSCSWGGGAPDSTAEQIFKQMAAQGQSFFNATGDSDAFTGAIEFPSDSTNITEVGGTSLTTTGPAGGYVSETVWNWGLHSGSYVGSSGGISTYYPIPAYQQGINMAANLGSTTFRNVPDVALTADGVWVTYGNGSSGSFGGTSCAAPLWAGFMALVNQQAAQAGRPSVGFLNPAIYNLGTGASYATAFHDTTTGNNTWPSSPNKFYAVSGYDLCTGWGTPNGTNLINALAGSVVPAPLIASNAFALVGESCAPTNGAADPSETVTVSWGLKNIGSANTTNLVVTLLATNGVSAPSGPQTYGVLTAGGSGASRAFTFTASGSCGAYISPTLQLQDGAANLGTLSVTLQLGQLANLFSQNFDAVTAPALPAGWTTATSGAQSAWVAASSSSDTGPNAAFSPDPAGVGVNELDSPVINLPAAAGQLSFRHNYAFEAGSGTTGYDGGVLDIKIAGGAFTDIASAGGSFVSGGYTHTLSSSYSNPLGGRQAWSGSSGGFVTSLINLPAAAAGQAIQLRWRCGSDSSGSSTGWYVDTVTVLSRTCCGQVFPPVALFSATPTTGGAPLTVTFNDASSGTINNRLWNFGNGVTTNTAATSLAFTYQSPGTNTVSLTVGGPQGTNILTRTAYIVVTNPVPQVLSNSFLLVAESCANGAVDPGETVTVNFGLRNAGTANTANLVATLQTTGGIILPSGPQAYGVLVGGGAAVSRPFTFTALGVCGAVSTATLQLQDGAANLGTVPFSFALGQSSPFTENFDGVAAPALPPGWTTSAGGAQSAWVTSTSASDTAPNSAFSPDPAAIGTNELVTPVITLPAAAVQLSFRHNYNLEAGSGTTGFDGGVLEIKIGNGTFTDILAAGGSFASGGYTRTISSSYGNPLAGRQAWSGNSGGFTNTVVNLPTAALGQNIQLRWRCGTDSSVSVTGWYVDSITIGGFSCCTGRPALLSPHRATNGSFTFTLAGNAGFNYAIEVTTNFSNWLTVTTLTNSTGQVLFTDTNSASLRLRAFRAKLIP
jgi:PKD repeat protein